MLKKNIFFFLLMENLGAMAYSRYTGFGEITDCDVLELHCIGMATILVNGLQLF